ncbi:MAG: UDP-glucose 4-epimerase GalE [Bacillota bacterium]
MNVLVTGGAGYIGSQITLDLHRAGHNPVILDNFSKGHPKAIKAGKLVRGDIEDGKLVSGTIRKYDIEAVVHLAAYSLAGESMTDPGKYFRNNIGNGLALLDAMREACIKYIVFSSTAAVYGEPRETPITETHEKNPTNYYGFSKLTFEKILDAYARVYGMRYISLRYFNAAGADPEVEIGEDHKPESHLIPALLQTALGLKPYFELYGTDYPTHDGTCIRDYIHVKDLSSAHLLALEKLSAGGDSAIYNLGSGRGFSNRQVINAVRKVTGKDIPIRERPRRPGDPAVLLASSHKIQSDLGWTPEHSDLENTVNTAWDWHRKHPRGYETET